MNPRQVNETSENGIKSTKGDTLGCEESEKGIESAPIINSDDEAEKVMNERLDKESVYTGETIEDDSYTRWKNGLKVVNIPKFDLNYFQRGLGYHINKVTSCYPVEFYGIMVEATEDCTYT